MAARLDKLASVVGIPLGKAVEALGSFAEGAFLPRENTTTIHTRTNLYTTPKYTIPTQYTQYPSLGWLKKGLKEKRFPSIITKAFSKCLTKGFIRTSKLSVLQWELS